jgi:hypothetical protein
LKTSLGLKFTGANIVLKLAGVQEADDGWRCGYVCAWWLLKANQMAVTCSEHQSPDDAVTEFALSVPPTPPDVWVELIWIVLRAYTVFKGIKIDRVGEKFYNAINERVWNGPTSRNDLADIQALLDVEVLNHKDQQVAQKPARHVCWAESSTIRRDDGGTDDKSVSVTDGADLAGTPEMLRLMNECMVTRGEETHEGGNPGDDGALESQVPLGEEKFSMEFQSLEAADDDDDESDNADEDSDTDADEDAYADADKEAGVHDISKLTTEVALDTSSPTTQLNRRKRKPVRDENPAGTFPLKRVALADSDTAAAADYHDADDDADDLHDAVEPNTSSFKTPSTRKRKPATPATIANDSAACISIVSPSLIVIVATKEQSLSTFRKEVSLVISKLKVRAAVWAWCGVSFSEGEE